MATKMTKGKTRGNAAVLGSNQYLKKGGKVRTKKYLTGGTSEEEPSAPKAASAYKSKFTTYSPSGNYKSVSTEKSDATGTSRSTKTTRTAKGFVKNIFGSSDVPRASKVDNAMQKKKGGMVKSKSKKK